jgi:hypothetical protein
MLAVCFCEPARCEVNPLSINIIPLSESLLLFSSIRGQLQLSTFNPSNTSGAYGNPGSGNPWEGAAAAAKAAAEKEAHGAAHRGHLGSIVF